MKVFTAASVMFPRFGKLLITQQYGYRNNGSMRNHFTQNTNDMGQTVVLLIGKSREQNSINYVICENMDMIGSTLKGTRK